MVRGRDAPATAVRVAGRVFKSGYSQPVSIHREGIQENGKSNGTDAV